MQSQLIARFVEAVGKYGSKTAVVDYPDEQTPRRTSYVELMTRARQVAARIQQQGIATQSFITIELPASADFLAAQMGIWLARHVAVAVGITFPEERKQFIRNHCEASLNIDRTWLEGLSADTPLADISVPDESDYAMLIYTSGSTGTPKGILHDHESLDVNGMKMFDTYQLTSTDRFAAGIPPYFVAEIFYWKIIFGTELHIVPPDVTKDVIRMADYHRQNGITIAFISATVFPIYRCTAPSMRAVITGSDRIICRQMPDYRVVSTYGLSETVGPVVQTDITEPTENAPIGLPIPGIEFAILDDDMRPVAQGEEGEICLKGHFCKGYYKDEERTRALYRGGWLHTSDLGRVLPDGRIQFVNRKDWMVKVNGQRVEPGEVEVAMRSIGGIDRAVVKGFSTGNGSQYLVGYYTPVTVSEETVRRELERKLPSYMVPSFFVPMESFPLNNNGKIDRLSLTVPNRVALTADYAEPRNATEAALCDIMAQVTGVPLVGIDDNFRSLGGDSIQMMTMQQMCADSDIEQLHLISTAIIYEGATPRRMAELLEQSAPKVKPQMDDYPLNAMQKIHFNTCIENEDKPVVNIPTLYRVDEHIDAERLRVAVEKAVSSHATFNTRLFVNDSGEPRQKILEEPFSLTIEHLSAEGFEAEKKRLVQPYHVLRERLFRIRLFEVEGEHYLFIDVNHIIFDGTSLDIFCRDINRAYLGLPIEEEDWTLGQMAAENEALRKGEAFKRAREWFLRTFDKEQLVRPWPADSDTCPFAKTLSLGISYSEVERFAGRIGVTMNAVTTAAYMLLIGQYASTNDVTVLAVHSARNDLRTRNTIGYLASQILVRGQWTSTMPTSDFLSQVGKALVDSMGHSIFTLGDVIDEWQTMPSYQFLYQGDLVRTMTIDGYELKNTPLEIEPGFPIFDIHLFHDSAADGFNIQTFTTSKSRDEAYIERWTGRYAECLRALTTAKTVGQALPSVPEEDKFFNGKM